MCIRDRASLITKLALPCLIVDSMRGTASLSELQNCGILLVLALVTLGIELLLGQGTYLLAGRTSSGRIFRFGMTYTNFTFMGIPVVEALFGSQGVFYFVVFLVPIRIVYYSTAKLMLSPPGITHGKQTFLQHLRGWLSPPVVAVLVGLVLYLTGWHLPTVLDDVVHSVGSICSPLGMLLCGISLGEYPFRQLLRRKYLLLPLVRDLALPGLLLLLTRLLPVENQLSNLMVIYAALPLSLIHIFGKPNPLMMRTGLRLLDVHSGDAAMSGDRMDTDVIAGIESGLDPILVLTGVTSREDIDRYPYRPRLVLNGVGDIPD